MPLELNKHQS